MDAIRVLVLLQRPEAWVNFLSVWEAMRADPAFEATLWLLPYDVRDSAKSALKAVQARAMLADSDVAFEEWKPGMSLRPGSFDVAIFGHPYDRERPAELRFQAVAAVIPTTVYLPYGLSVGGGWKNLRLQFAQPTQRYATAIIARSEAEKEAYARHCPSGNSHVYTLGHPRFDTLASRLEDGASNSLAQWIDGRMCVMWNSHFSFAPEYSFGSNFSTLDLLGPALVSIVGARRRRLCMIWRPHPATFSELARTGLLQMDEVPSLARELDSIGVRLDLGADHLPAFLASHALVTDVGSFLIEYLAMRRPLLALVNPEGEPLNEEAHRLIADVPVASDAAACESFVDLLLTGRAEAPSSTLLRRHLPLLDGRSGLRVTALLKGLHGHSMPSEAEVDEVSEGWFASRPPPFPSSERRLECDPVLQSTPLVDRLFRDLAAIAASKARLAPWSKRVRRARNLASGLLFETAKQVPWLLGAADKLRSVLSRRR